MSDSNRLDLTDVLEKYLPSPLSHYGYEGGGIKLGWILDDLNNDNLVSLMYESGLMIQEFYAEKLSTVTPSKVKNELRAGPSNLNMLLAVHCYRVSKLESYSKESVDSYVHENMLG